MRARDVNAELGTSNREKRSHETLMIVASQETQFAEQVLFRNGGIEPTHRQTLLPTARRIFERPSPSIAGGNSDHQVEDADGRGSHRTQTEAAGTGDSVDSERAHLNP